MENRHQDVIIVGAGLSGVGAAHYIQDRCPERSYTILEARSAMGGTWDLFRYPGIRSDSDMFTLGYAHRPWRDPKAIADGPSILKYIQDLAEEEGIDKNIQYNFKVKSASWSSENAQWTVATEQTETKEIVQFTCNFLFMCSGYYSYDAGYTPDFKNLDQYKGNFVHPQEWTENIEYAGKKVIVIGSGATAITLVPELAKEAEKVVMLQRSPTYLISKPSEDKVANFLRRWLPAKMAYFLIRWRNILLGILFFNLSRSKPNFMKKLFIAGIKKELGPDYDVSKHFTPTYNPWDQRVCLVTNSDLFAAIKEDKVEMVTDHIEAFTEKGIKLKSGAELKADLIVSATGLQLKFMAGMEITVDNQKISPPDLLAYRGMMFNNVPNLAMSTGYTNASWTLKTDLTCEYVCRLLNHMKKTGTKQCIARTNGEPMEKEPLLDFNSGYVLRSIDNFPKQGSKHPWKLHQNYAKDIFNFRYSSLKDKVLEFK